MEWIPVKQQYHYKAIDKIGQSNGEAEFKQLANGTGEKWKRC